MTARNLQIHVFHDRLRPCLSPLVLCMWWRASVTLDGVKYYQTCEFSAIDCLKLQTRFLNKYLLRFQNNIFICRVKTNVFQELIIKLPNKRGKSVRWPTQALPPAVPFEKPVHEVYKLFFLGGRGLEDTSSPHNMDNWRLKVSAINDSIACVPEHKDERIVKKTSFGLKFH